MMFPFAGPLSYEAQSLPPLEYICYIAHLLSVLGRPGLYTGGPTNAANDWYEMYQSAAHVIPTQTCASSSSVALPHRHEAVNQKLIISTDGFSPLW